MTLYFKVGTMPGKHYAVVRRRKVPAVGERFEIVDREVRWSRPFAVRLLEVRDLGGHDLYVVVEMS